MKEILHFLISETFCRVLFFAFMNYVSNESLQVGKKVRNFLLKDVHDDLAYAVSIEKEVLLVLPLLVEFGHILSIAMIVARRCQY